MKYLFTAVIALSLSTPSFAKPHEWKACHIVSQQTSAYNAGSAVIPVGNIWVAAPLRRTSNEVIIETDGHRYTLLEKPSRHFLIFFENGNTRFYQEGGWFVFLDVKNKEHKFSLEHAEVLDKQSQK